MRQMEVIAPERGREREIAGNGEQTPANSQHDHSLTFSGDGASHSALATITTTTTAPTTMKERHSTPLPSSTIFFFFFAFNSLVTERGYPVQSFSCLYPAAAASDVISWSSRNVFTALDCCLLQQWTPEWR